MNKTQEKLLTEWNKACARAEEAKKVLDEERELRAKVAKAFFKQPEEGVNEFELANGWVLKLTYPLNRKVDERVLPSILQTLREEQKVNADHLVRFKPELNTKDYKKLALSNPDAVKVFDEALTVSPGSPKLVLVAPKEEE